jgi:hypothetical protein
MGSHLTSGDFPQFDNLFGGGYFDGLAPGAHIHGKLRPKRLFVGYKKVGFFSDYIADMIREPTVGIRNIRAPFHHENLGLFIEPPETRRTRRPASHTAYNNDFHRYTPV